MRGICAQKFRFDRSDEIYVWLTRRAKKFPLSLYIQQKFLLFSWLEKKNATGINSPQNAKSSSSSFFFFVFFASCVSLNQAIEKTKETRVYTPNYSSHTKAPEKEQQKEVFWRKKKDRNQICVFFFLVCVFLLLLSSSFEKRERYFARRQRCAKTEDRHYIVIRFLSVVIVARVENAHSS